MDTFLIRRQKIQVFKWLSSDKNMAESIKIIVLETIVHDSCKCKGIVILHLFILFYNFVGLFATCPLQDPV